MASFFDALTRLLGLLWQVADGVVGWLKPVAKKAATFAARAARWVATAVLGVDAEQARAGLILRLVPANATAALAHAREPGKARRLFQLVGWRLHGGGPRGEGHVEAA